MIPYTESEVMEILGQGGKLLYFYLDGTVGVEVDHKPAPKYCPIEIFLNLRDSVTITKTGHREHGYPYYADNAKYGIYTKTA